MPDNPIAGISSDKFKMALQAGFAGVFLIFMMVSFLQMDTVLKSVADAGQRDSARAQIMAERLIRLIEHTQAYRCERRQERRPEFDRGGLTDDEMKKRLEPFQDQMRPN